MAQGARNAARLGYRLSVLGYQVDKGEEKYRTSGGTTRRAPVIGYQLCDYEHEREHKLIGG